MNKKIKEEFAEILKEARQNQEPLEIKKEVILQYSKQLFIRIPKDLERLLSLKKGMKLRFVVRIPPRKSKEKIGIKLEVVG